jgi:hypothetical protein
MHWQFAWFQECCEHQEDAETGSAVEPHGQDAHPPGLRETKRGDKRAMQQQSKASVMGRSGRCGVGRTTEARVIIDDRRDCFLTHQFPLHVVVDEVKFRLSSPNACFSVPAAELPTRLRTRAIAKLKRTIFYESDTL